MHPQNQKNWWGVNFEGSYLHEDKCKCKKLSQIFLETPEVTFCIKKIEINFLAVRSTIIAFSSGIKSCTQELFHIVDLKRVVCSRNLRELPQ